MTFVVKLLYLDVQFFLGSRFQQMTWPPGACVVAIALTAGGGGSRLTVTVPVPVTTVTVPVPVTVTRPGPWMCSDQGCTDRLYRWTCRSWYRGPSVPVQGVAGPGTVRYKYDLTRSNFAKVKAVVKFIHLCQQPAHSRPTGRPATPSQA